MALMDSFINNAQVLLSGFHKPEVLKPNDEGLQNQIAYLESHPSKENNQNLARLKKGVEGEKNVLFQLENSGIGMYILHGIHINDTAGGDDAQIDFVVVTRGYVYLIECKNWSGNWKICKDGIVLIRNGKKTISRESPIAQNQRHMEILKQRWRQKSGKVANILFSSQFEKNWYKPLVVVSNYESILDLKDATKYDREHIVRADQLPAFIKKDLKTYAGREPFSTKKEMRAVADGFLKAEKEYQEKYAQEKAQRREVSQPKSVYDYKRSKLKFQSNLRNFCKRQAQLEGKTPSGILTNQDIHIIMLHNYSDPNELEKVPISQAKKEKYGKVIVAAYNDAFGQNS